MLNKDTGEFVLPFIRSANNYDTEAASLASGLACEDPTRARQEFKEETDINTIVERFGLGYEAPAVPDFPTSVDYSEFALDYHSALNLVKQAEEEFMTLPAAVRDKFGHDPGAILAFLEDDKNRDEAVKLGLLEQPKVVAETTVQPAQPAQGTVTT